jgi:cytochrome c oxidase cbb3-type subunit 3
MACRDFESMWDESLKLMRNLAAVLIIAAPLFASLSCEREQRSFREAPPGATPSAPVRQTELQAGPAEPPVELENPYEENAYALSEGKRLYEAYNCAGCHAHGGGDIGPPLMDDKWIYGASPQNIFSTIIEGRPNGMPSFSGKIPASQVWQIVAYVRSMSGQVSKDAAPGRSDHMSGKKPEQSKEKETPVGERAKHPE